MTTIQVGTVVRTNVEFCGVPKNTLGVVDEDYGSGLMVAWDLHDVPLPPDYIQYIQSGGNYLRHQHGFLLRDGFDRDELHYLEVVNSVTPPPQKMSMD